MIAPALIIATIAFSAFLETIQPDGCSAREVVRLDFDALPTGPLTPVARSRHWSSSAAATQRARIEGDGANNRVLVIEYPRDRAGSSENGTVFVVDLPPGLDYYLRYRFKLSESFDFRNGGKLPGLSSRGCTFSGGRVPMHGEGWSARLVWLAGGRVAVYLYHAGMQKEFGDALHLTTGPLRKGEWHTIVERVTLNTGHEPNGVLQVWVNGVLGLDRRDIRFRSGPLAPIESLCVSTFHGGTSRTEYGPRTDGIAIFDDFVITEQEGPACDPAPPTRPIAGP